MEARTVQDIKRNAMVGVFLRLLEYYNGVLFLTTNRVQYVKKRGGGGDSDFRTSIRTVTNLLRRFFDEAFYSRVSVSIHYTHLEEEARGQVWHNLLSSANVPHYFGGAPCCMHLLPILLFILTYHVVNPDSTNDVDANTLGEYPPSSLSVVEFRIFKKQLVFEYIEDMILTEGK